MGVTLAQNFGWNLAWMMVLLGVMIIIHELGHYWAARFFDVKVETFSFGFGPRLFGFRKGETDFRFSAILFGGYVKMTGEQPGESTDDPRGFLNKPRWQRLIIAFAGPAMNIVLAVVVLTGLFMFRYPKMLGADGPAIIGHVTKDSPAMAAGVQPGDRIIRLENDGNPTWEDVVLKELTGANKAMPVIVEREGGKQVRMMVTPKLDEKTGAGFIGWAEQAEVKIADILPNMDAGRAGLKRGDVIVSVNGQPILSPVRLHEIIRASEGNPVDVIFARDGQRDKVSVRPTYKEDEKRFMIGVQLEPRVVITKLSFPEALSESVRQNAKSAMVIFQFLEGIVEQRNSPKSLEGPIRIAKMSGEAARDGAASFLGLMAMVSLNLAIFNLLPIPVLDGGMIVLLLLEMLMRRDMSLRFKENVFKLGLVFLLSIVVFVIYNDISKTMGG